MIIMLQLVVLHVLLSIRTDSSGTNEAVNPKKVAYSNCWPWCPVGRARNRWEVQFQLLVFSLYAANFSRENVGGCCGCHLCYRGCQRHCLIRLGFPMRIFRASGVACIRYPRSSSPRKSITPSRIRIADIESLLFNFFLCCVVS